MGELTTLRCPITADLGLLRQQVRSFVAAAGFAGMRLRDVVLAVNEAADNVLEHGGGSGIVVAHADAEGVWIEVIDPAGTLTLERFQQRTVVPPPIAAHGYGLWVIARLSDQVLIDHPEGGCRLRLRFTRRLPRIA
ncbi:ATP-binding protein [Nonomuraea angiospora]|uniref:Anti-sigma regulatory factor (Ser/Thr protein kinase) n=1 Tax=Nonomuraea angiospora TaxID=46172 RepID=A0ABR9MIG4_9ACTN|nr:ATP-binding protein [Nonomuraea angiospora]MBE1592318.1 anti-sigma regulatory factor (Ser/Thr protein kinase) [Nonomuraea angiospora]